MSATHCDHVRKTTTKEKTPKETDVAPRVNIQDFCKEHYKDILSVIMDKIRRDKRKEVHTRLDFGDNTKARHGYHSRDKDRPRIMKRGRESESPLSHVSESGTSDGGHWKSK
ncbi:hypothetical protein Tco_0748779 [Tanacetum coccineum]|uniref:Reverse transcriptase domain-containing protein n=1 Tax=Tanacetum coccineum TaxID=301880 RepID=A0ABQ4YZZ4_9ASTR